MLHIRLLIWDTWNVSHIARHQVIPQEAEEVCHGNYIVRVAYAGRIMVIGPTNSGRMLAIVLDPERDGNYYVVTARPADRGERRIYRETMQGDAL